MNDYQNGRRCWGTFFRYSVIDPVRLSSFTDGTSNTITVGEQHPLETTNIVHLTWSYCNGNWKSTYTPLNWSPPEEQMDNWPDQLGFRSKHPGGSHFCWGDGHVTLFSETIDMNVYQGLSTRNQGEMVQYED